MFLLSQKSINLISLQSELVCANALLLSKKAIASMLFFAFAKKALT